MHPLRRKRRLRTPGVRREDDPPRDEDQWLNRQRATPSSSTIPATVLDSSAVPEKTLAWIMDNCNFVKHNYNEEQCGAEQ